MDILAALPDTHAGRRTWWVWTRMLAMAGGAAPPESGELAAHFAPGVLEQVPVDQLVAHLAHLAPTMPRVTRLVEEESGAERYVALLGDNPLTLRFGIDNVANKRYWASAFDQSRPDLLQGAPRTFKLSASIDL